MLTREEGAEQRLTRHEEVGVGDSSVRDSASLKARGINGRVRGLAHRNCSGLRFTCSAETRGAASRSRRKSC